MFGGFGMSHYVTLELSSNTYTNLIDWLTLWTPKAIENYNEMEELVHLVDLLEEEYQRDSTKQSKELKEWSERQKFFEGDYNNSRYYFNFDKVDKIFKEYEENCMLEWKISNQDKFHLICEIIDTLVNDNEEEKND